MNSQPQSIFKTGALWTGVIICVFIAVMSASVSLALIGELFDPRVGKERASVIIAFAMISLPTLLFGWLAWVQYRAIRAGRPKTSPRPKCNPFVCADCGSEAPTINVSFNRHFGAVILMFHHSVKGRFCRSCISKIFWNWTPLTFFFGWWGLLSAFITPVVLINNLVMYLRSFAMPGGGGRALTFGDSEIAAVSTLSTDIVSRVNSGEDLESLAKEIATASGISPAQAYVYVQYRLTQSKEPSLVG